MLKIVFQLWRKGSVEECVPVLKNVFQLFRKGSVEECVPVV